MKSLRGQKLVIATHNKGKVPEIAALLEPYGVEVTSAGELGISEPEETEATFKGNALLKAHHSAKASGLPALADDSGLAVDALDGKPGIYSARWAVKDGVRDFNYAMEKVNDELGENDNRTARFICSLALVWPDGEEACVEGFVEGDIVWPARGDKGFGYDPVFQPKGFDITFAEMEPQRKHEMSHRADAFKKLVELVFADDA
ncbi:RdgB/HAM1 family non-canonical purine NTP pyrophosphatase [Curvivirga sp.]|uniref:RdgB/HAM1 family non-canonical purine NTP pyrophosphatase n=1 Tax=Curvivirga sp. TaxID=2856848 RepID=UPI003B5BAEF2